MSASLLGKRGISRENSAKCTVSTNRAYDDGCSGTVDAPNSVLCPLLAQSGHGLLRAHSRIALVVCAGWRQHSCWVCRVLKKSLDQRTNWLVLKNMNAATPKPHPDARARLLDTAVQVIRTQGYTASTVDDICRAAGLTKGAFFHHFKSKEDLAVAAATHFSQMAERL